jgi:predicted RND superfamily exporter protein
VSRFIRWLLKHRAVVGITLVLTLVAALFFARTIRVQFQFRDFYDFPESARSTLLRRDIERFGDPTGFVVALVEAGDVFEPKVLEYLQKLTLALEPDKTFSRVISLSNAHTIRGEGDDVISAPLFSDVPRNEAELLRLKRFALSSALLRRRLISPDGKTTAVLAEMRTPSAYATIAEQEQAIGVVRHAALAQHPPAGVRVDITGSPVVDVGVTRALIRDQLILVPGVILVLAIVIFLAFRSLHSVLLCLATVGVAAIWTAGAYALLHRPVDIIGSMVPMSILVYGVVDPIFVLTRVLQKRAAGREQTEAIVEALSELGLPCFLTSLTTAFGFAAFLTAHQPTVRFYGGTVAVGVLSSWLTTVTVLPILLSLVVLPKTRFSALNSTRWLDAMLRSVWVFLSTRIRRTLLITAGLFLVGGFFATRQRIDNQYVNELPRGATRNDVRRFEQQLSGIASMTVHLEGARDTMKQPEVLKRIEAIDAGMEKLPLVNVASSLADLIAEANQAFFGGQAEERKVPSSRALIAQYLTLSDPGDRASFVSDDYSQAQIALSLVDPGSQKFAELAEELRRRVDRAGFEALGVKATVSGKGVVAYEELDNVVVGLLYGFLFAFIAIVLLQWLVFRSLRLAVISIVPNLLPVIACFLCLRLFAIQLRIDTALVLCTSVGGLFNTTIHFSARVRQLAGGAGATPDQVIGQAMSSIGPPALFTAGALSIGFAVLFGSSFAGLQALGLLMMVTLSVGFISDMVVTAVLLRIGFAWQAPAPGAALDMKASIATDSSPC